MKKSILFISIVLLLFACSQDKHETKIIPDYERIYLSSDKADVPPQLGESTGKILDEKILTAIRKVFKAKKRETTVQFNLVIYINDEGAVDGIQFKEKELQENKGKITNLFFNEIQEAVADAITGLKFKAASNGGKNINSRLSWMVSLVVDKSGSVTKVFQEGMPFLPPPRDFAPEKYTTKADESPMPIGGIEAILKLIQYPEDAKKSGIEGKVLVQAFIDENGKVVQTGILRGTNSALDTAAMNTVMKVKFTPAKVKGKAVKSQVVIPIQFSLKY